VVESFASQPDNCYIEKEFYIPPSLSTMVPFPILFTMENEQITYLCSSLPSCPCIDFLWLEITEPKEWFPTLFLLNECLTPKSKSCAVIKLPNNNFDALTVQMLYICSLLFEKMFLVKPAVSNFLSLDKYLVIGKGEKSGSQLPSQFLLSTENIQQLMHLAVPYLYISKLTEINVIITKPVLEVLNEFLQYQQEKKCLQKEEEKNHEAATVFFSFSYKWKERMKFHEQLVLQWREKFHFF
jgi:hypothetical protein